MKVAKEGGYSREKEDEDYVDGKLAELREMIFYIVYYSKYMLTQFHIYSIRHLTFIFHLSTSLRLATFQVPFQKYIK